MRLHPIHIVFTYEVIGDQGITPKSGKCQELDGFIHHKPVLTDVLPHGDHVVWVNLLCYTQFDAFAGPNPLGEPHEM